MFASTCPAPEAPATRREPLAEASRNLWTDGGRLRGYLDALDDARIPFDGGRTEERVTQDVARMLPVVITGCPFRSLLGGPARFL
ncbi:hypothetical protein ACFSKW_32780 [Nonomuraea mangrovi]|uniref:Uncharacterized protein n=1 Tax=Nonomuraea mangrovi TaxID=2316207 RepID=A0ABW4T2V6_9ACTN